MLFCLALGDYNVAAHQPHPPGFPLYVLLAKIARFLTPSDFTALQSINVLAGMAVFPVVFFLARSLRFAFAPAIIAATMFTFLPNVWFFGGTAFSDLPAAVLFLATIAAYLDSGASTRRYVMASLLFGAALLFRPQNALVVVFPWTIATVRLARARQWRAIVAGCLLAALITVAGFSAAAVLTGSDAYVASVEGHSRFVRQADTVVNPDRVPVLRVLWMQFDPYEAGKVSILVNVLALIGIVRGPRKSVLETILTFAPFFLFAALVVNPMGLSRFSLNYLAAFALLASLGIVAVAGAVQFVVQRLGWNTDLRVFAATALCAVIVGRFIQWTLPAFESPRSTHSPPAQAAQWIDRNVPRSSTIFVHHGIWPWARYFIHGRELVYVEDHAPIVRHPRARDGWFIHMDTTQFPGGRTFSRQRDRVWNIVTRRAFEATVVPARSIVAFTSGWHQPEGEGVTWRWSQRTAKMELPPLGGDCELQLNFSLPVRDFKRPLSVTFIWNGQRLGTYTTSSPDNQVTLLVRSTENAPNVLEIRAHQPFVPRRMGWGADERELGIQLHSGRWRRL